jgi:hypothetical protein
MEKTAGDIVVLTPTQYGRQRYSRPLPLEQIDQSESIYLEPVSERFRIAGVYLHSYLARQLRNACLNEPPQLEPELFFNRQPSFTLPKIARMLCNLGF